MGVASSPLGATKKRQGNQPRGKPTRELRSRFASPRPSNLNSCSNLTDGAVGALASHCPGLTTANLSCCRNLTDGAVEALASHCPGLTDL